MVQCRAQYRARRGRADRTGQQAFAELNRGGRGQGLGFEVVRFEMCFQGLRGVIHAEKSPDGALQFAQGDQPAFGRVLALVFRARFRVAKHQGYDHHGDRVDNQRPGGALVERDLRKRRVFRRERRHQ